MAQAGTAALTSDLQAVPELSHTSLAGGHAAIAPGIRESGSGHLQAFPVPGQAQPRSGRELFVPLVPGDVWREEES